jgi:hypothetical protein
MSTFLFRSEFTSSRDDGFIPSVRKITAISDFSFRGASAQTSNTIAFSTRRWSDLDVFADPGGLAWWTLRNLERNRYPWADRVRDPHRHGMITGSGVSAH